MQNSTSLGLNRNLVVKREKKWLKNERNIFVGINGNLQGINRSWSTKDKKHFKDVNGSLADCSWSMIVRKHLAEGRLGQDPTHGESKGIDLYGTVQPKKN
ncbi:hypothetical protein GQ41_0210 [Arenibacter algicola]|uniref:Uncharacterized protein n=1 Tax=Arenibacter algicola TaxID=616991 RepID=A0ABY3A5X0_9FLAO